MKERGDGRLPFLFPLRDGRRETGDERRDGNLRAANFHAPIVVAYLKASQICWRCKLDGRIDPDIKSRGISVSKDPSQRKNGKISWLVSSPTWLVADVELTASLRCATRRSTFNSFFVCFFFMIDFLFSSLLFNNNGWKMFKCKSRWGSSSRMKKKVKSQGLIVILFKWFDGRKSGLVGVTLKIADRKKSSSSSSIKF